VVIIGDETESLVFGLKSVDDDLVPARFIVWTFGRETNGQDNGSSSERVDPSLAVLLEHDSESLLF
jgi:hypothetical protein